MKKLLSTASLAAIAMALAFAPRVHAQIQTFNTIQDYNGQGSVGFTNGTTALTETFNNTLELNSVTFQFIQSAGTDTVDQTIQAYLVQWNTTTNEAMSTFTAPTVIGTTAQMEASDATTAPATPYQTYTVPPYAGDSNGSWSTGNFPIGGNAYQYFNITLNLGQLMDPTLTYAIVLVDITNASGVGLLNLNDNGSYFPNGTGAETTSLPAYSNPASTLTALEGHPEFTSGVPGADYGIAQISLVPAGNIIPTPEPRTAAAILCALFVAALVGRQLLLRRQEEVAVGTILAA